MKTVLLPLADGFEEIEAMSIVDVLRRADIKVIIAGLKEGEVKGSRGVRLLPDETLDAVKDQDFDMVILPGGQPGTDNLRNDSRVLEILKKRHDQKKLIGAICAAPLVLRDAGITPGMRITSYPSFESELTDGQYEQTRVVVHDHIITSRGPGTAMEFALKLVEILAGKEKAEQLSADLLVTH